MQDLAFPDFANNAKLPGGIASLHSILPLGEIETNAAKFGNHAHHNSPVAWVFTFVLLKVLDGQ